MKKWIICILLLTAAAGGRVSAGEIREIELTDGSVITAEILSFQNGIYTLQSDIMGKLIVEDEKVRAIRRRSAKATRKAPEPDAGAPSVSGMDVTGLMSALTEDPEIMARIMSLQDDPDVQKIMSDPALMEAVNSGNIAALITNPDFLKLLQNSKIQGIVGEMGQ